MLHMLIRFGKPNIAQSSWRQLHLKISCCQCRRCTQGQVVANEGLGQEGHNTELLQGGAGCLSNFYLFCPLFFFNCFFSSANVSAFKVGCEL